MDVPNVFDKCAMDVFADAAKKAMQTVFPQVAITVRRLAHSLYLPPELVGENLTPTPDEDE